jgi:hypothetical protein
MANVITADTVRKFFLNNESIDLSDYESIEADAATLLAEFEGFISFFMK